MLRCIRGAACASENTKEAIFETTSRLMDAVVKENNLTEDNIISILLTATPDLNADFPAVAIRTNRFKDVPVLCATEMAVKGAMKRVIRMLVHVDVDLDRSQIKHIYQDETAALRPDLAGFTKE